mmetsp:Transcript_21685/g.61451  ORF Transcript_21685/g.61451 Transcript_21685/m.61451 type:complete len:205 (+) Transcript_21685:977-1591(+)
MGQLSCHMVRVASNGMPNNRVVLSDIWNADRPSAMSEPGLPSGKLSTMPSTTMTPKYCNGQHSSEARCLRTDPLMPSQPTTTWAVWLTMEPSSVVNSTVCFGKQLALMLCGFRHSSCNASSSKAAGCSSQSKAWMTGLTIESSTNRLPQCKFASQYLCTRGFKNGLRVVARGLAASSGSAKPANLWPQMTVPGRSASSKSWRRA